MIDFTIYQALVIMALALTLKAKALVLAVWLMALVTSLKRSNCKFFVTVIWHEEGYVVYKTVL